MPDLQPQDRSAPALPTPAPARDTPGARSRHAVDASQALEENARAMFRSARRVSLCEDDAHDAVQAAAERFLRHRESVDAETVTGWLVTVARNEALRVRERRVRTGPIEDDDRRLVHTGDGPEDLAARAEAVSLAREALGRLKPQERQALWLQAEGRSYDEIAAELEWTRTKVNRNLSEGRARLRRTLTGIASGEGCASAAPRIDRLAAGAASVDDLRALRPHLRRCSSCRGRLRRARGGRWAVVPPVLLGWLPWASRSVPADPSAARPRFGQLLTERVVTLLPATSGAVTETGLLVTAGVAAVALGAGVATGGIGEEPTDPQPRRAATVRSAAAASPVPLAGRVRIAAPAGGLRQAAAPRAGSTAEAGERRRRAAERAARARAARERARLARRRADARRRAARKAAAIRAGTVAAAPFSAAPVSPTAAGGAGAATAGAPSPSAPTAPGAGGGSPAPAGSGSSGASSSGAASAGRGSQAGGGAGASEEFGFE